MPRYPKGAVTPTGTGFTYVTSGVQDVAALSEIPASASPELVQLIKQVHPKIQVLAAMDEATYTQIEKSGNNYVLPASLDFSTWDEVDPNSSITVTPTLITASSLARNALANVSTSFDGSADFEFKFIYQNIAFSPNNNFAAGCGVGDAVTDYYKGAGVTSLVLWPNGLTVIYFSKFAATTETRAVGSITISGSTNYYCTLSRSGTTVTLSMFTDAGRTTHATGSPLSMEEVATTNYVKKVLMWTSNDGAFVDSSEVGSDQYNTGNIKSNAVSTNSAILSFFELLKQNVIIGTSSHATPVQAEIYGDADAYAAPLHSTKFTIDPADPIIHLYRDSLDTITASSNTQTVWNMTVAGGLPALPNHGSILATQIGVASVIMIEKSILGDFSDTEILTEETDYIVDYSTNTSTKITLVSGTGIVNAQSKIRISWIADVMDIAGTANTALKTRIYLNRTNTGETSPLIQPIDIGTLQYVEFQYRT